MPGAGHLRAAGDGGHLQGGAPRAVWQAAGADPAVVSARSAAERLSELGRACHLTWNPLTGEIVQLVSILRAGRSLGGPEGLTPLGPAYAADSGARPAAAEPAGPDWLAEVNTQGRLCVQICVVAFAWDPFTAGPMTGLPRILDWLDSWGIPRRWPAGAPPAFPHGHTGCRSRSLWARGGHFAASQVPDWTAAGPGAIDIGRLAGNAASPGTGIPRPRSRGGQERAGTGQERTGQERAGQERADAGQERADEAGMADFDDMFEAPVAGSLSRVG
jgi:hypothetical protein